MFHETPTCNLRFLKNLSGCFPQRFPQLHNTTVKQGGIEGVKPIDYPSSNQRYPPTCGKSECFPQVFRPETLLFLGLFSPE
jgi:hypothetical protein